jgi:D-alanyl-D-alanine carboxypeptidase
MIGSSVMGLWPAAEVTLRDLLYGLMLPSGNDAAVELARTLAPSEQAFIDMMNERVRAMGLRNTHFTNPHGLDDWEHYSSAYDMAAITRHAMRNQRFREIANTPVHHLAPPFDYDVHNGNSLLGFYPGANGVKIGWTEAAGWTFVASAWRDGREVIVSLMNSADRDADAAALLDWAFASPHWQGVEWTPPQSTPHLLDRVDGTAAFAIARGLCASRAER